jgi:hypothetical protein
MTDEELTAPRIRLWLWMANSQLTAREIRAIFADEIEALKDERGFRRFLASVKAGRKAFDAMNEEPKH